METARSGSDDAAPVVLEVFHLSAAGRADAPPRAHRRTLDPPPDLVRDDPNLAAGRAAGLLGDPGAVTPADAEWIHSTSWRVDGRSVVLTFLAFGADESRTAGWSELDPVDPAAPPDRSTAPTYSSVLHHAMRHLAFLAQRDPALREQLVAHGLERVLLAMPVPAGLIPERTTHP